jgi:hypothetical protein
MKVIQQTSANPYLDGLKAKAEAEKALKKLKREFGSMEQVGRKQIYLVDNVHGFPFYVWIVSAPSNLKFDSAIKGIMKQHGQYPLYVLFTRDVKSYPKTASATYWDKIKSVYKKGGSKFKGAIMGLDEFNSDIAEEMMEHNKIRLDYRRYVDITKGKGITIEQLLKEIGGLSSQKVKAISSMIRLIK